jgi:diguanylate cyclase (GGDEF)-like protein
MDDKATMTEKERVLVVDDEDTVRSVLYEVLTEDGFIVSKAASGEEALEKLMEETFALVITDIKMPGITGLELQQKIKKQYPDTQVVIITSHASLGTAISAMRHGAYDYLFKPFGDLDLISASAKRAVEKVRLTRENRELLVKLKKNNEELEKANRTLKNMACRDGLTGLYNHRYFQDILFHEVFRADRNNEQFSLVFFDLDNFKQYNDVNGHLEGDKLLRKLGQILKKAVRRSDVVARYGGEEFVIVLPSTPKKNAYVVGEKLRRYIETYPFDGRESQPKGKVTVSIGIATFPDDGTDRTELIHRADKAMYRAKEGGRNAVCVAGMQKEASN